MEKRITIKQCDRCGKEIDPLISDNQTVTYDVVEVTVYGRETLDLCPDCKNKLYHWIWKVEDK
jgi:hypothetical protein